MNWKSLLTNISQTLLDSDDLQDEFKAENLKWLGFEGASDTEIQSHESRLKTKLPPSYTEFLKVTNGFRQLNCFVWNILPIDKIDWLEKFDPAFFKLYSTEFKDAFNATDEEYFIYGEEQKMTDFRSDYLVNSLVVSEWGDAAILLLNPKVKFGDEWEAWMFAVWHHGPVRYKSFEELMQGEYSSYLELLSDGD
jgi:hypothetical protein